MGGRRLERWVAAVAVAGLIGAACSPNDGVDTGASSRIDSSVAPTDSSTPDPSRGELPSLSPPDPETLAGTLDNGLRYLIRDNDNPGSKAELRLAIDAGSGLEDADQSGGAHFLEHMLFNGTEAFPKNELVDLLRSFGAGFGADINAQTGFDDTIYTLTVPNTDDVVESGLDILEQWLSFATISPDDVDAERGIVLDEWRGGTQSSQGRIFDRFADFSLGGTVYDGHLPIGGKEPIESITPEALRRFYDDWYRPDLASVIVVGDIDPAEVEQWIIDRFSDAESRGADPDRPQLRVEPSAATRVAVADDAELPEGFVEIGLPLPVDTDASDEIAAQRSMLDALAFDIISTRLDTDALRGDAPYDRASPSSASIVRLLDAPEIVVDTGGDGVEASTLAITNEFERVARFGFSGAEVALAVGKQRSQADLSFEGRGSRQDASYADEYVRHSLTGEWYVPAEQEYAFVTAVLDQATPESVTRAFVDRYQRAGSHVFVAVPSAELGDTPDAAVLTAIVDGAADRDLEPRADEAAVVDSLLERPSPVDEIDRPELTDDPIPGILDPVVLEFANGVRVALNPNTIVEREVSLEARSPGGSNVVADDLVPDAQALSTVLGDSGIGPLDRVALDAFLADKEVSFGAYVDPSIDGMFGMAATDDLETLMQFINLTMTAPQADESAVERYVDDELPYAQDPSIDAGYAEYVALSDARYDDPRQLAPTPESLAGVDALGIEQVAAERFGNAADWSFAFTGDFDLVEAIDLARSYLGTLPSTGIAETFDPTEPPPPPGATVVETPGGEGDTANVSFLFTSTTDATRRSQLIADVVAEVVGNRLTDFIREELGDSYSPSASVDVGDGSTPSVETYLTVSTAPDLVDEVAAAVLDQLASLRTDGPSEREFTNATTAVREQLGFVDNDQINDELLAALVDPASPRSFDDFINASSFFDDVTLDEVSNAIVAWVPDAEYIEVRVLPR